MDFSLIASVFSTLRLTPLSKLTLLEAQEFTSRHFPPMPSDVDMLILHVGSTESASQVIKVLSANYPKDHKVFVVDGDAAVEIDLTRAETLNYSERSCVFVPLLGEGTSFEAFAEIVAHLRAPDGCPWDREQTHQTLRKHLLEESYETIAAMDANDVDGMKEEFGDLLLQIVLNAQIANEDGNFSIRDTIKNIYDKIVRRHPHVFGDLQVNGVEGVLANWEKLKEKERGGKEDKKGILDGVPVVLPALSQAQEYQDRAARVGFDWPDIEGVLDKVKEEIEEIKNAETDFELASEIGDLFFVLVNLARWKKVDAESALRGTNMKFKKRFAYIEQGAARQGRRLSDLGLDEMEILWQDAKRHEN